MGNLPQNRHTRRFVVKAFQFMDQTTNKFLNEEVSNDERMPPSGCLHLAGHLLIVSLQIYFMCSTEVCLSSQTTCKETCFDKKVCLETFYFYFVFNLLSKT